MVTSVFTAGDVGRSVAGPTTSPLADHPMTSAMMQSELPTLLTVADVAAHLRVSTRQVWRWIADDELKTVRLARLLGPREGGIGEGVHRPPGRARPRRPRVTRSARTYRDPAGRELTTLGDLERSIDRRVRLCAGPTAACSRPSTSSSSAARARPTW